MMEIDFVKAASSSTLMARPVMCMPLPAVLTLLVNIPTIMADMCFPVL